MAITGAVMLMARYKVINLKFAEDWEEEYKRSSPVDQVVGNAEAPEEPDEILEETKTPRARKTSRAKAEPTEKTTLKPSARAKKSQ